jgi:rSAM/selenodomain-associated transferase 2/rSAM/selenodomain-associated transferase 1
MSESIRERLIIFTRYPEPGTTKTRMILELGAEGAADLQRQMTDHVVSNLKEFIDLNSLAVEVRFEGGSEKRIQTWLGPSFSYRRQGDGDIGRRMMAALSDAFQEGYESVVIIGSDIPDIKGDILQQAFKKLQNKDLVLGPAADGGYYLIGMQMAAWDPAHPELFEDISWGTDEVLSQSLDKAKKMGLSFGLLGTLKDVDRPADLAVWNQASGLTPDGTRKILISIIIPTLNEADVIKATVARLPESENIEILVVDGGSRDNTVEIAQKLGTRVLIKAPSKAEQMNAGAAEARGDVLLFLHADTRLPANFEEIVMAAVSRDDVSAGAFTLGIDSKTWSLRFIERVANWRARIFKLPYGDQALFVGRDLFFEIGGFPDYPIMEDFEFIRRLKKKGQITILPQSVQTSPRRWQNFGVLKTWLLNQIIVAAYFIGIPPHRLAFWYRREKGRSAQKKV